MSGNNSVTAGQESIQREPKGMTRDGKLIADEVLAIAFELSLLRNDLDLLRAVIALGFSSEVTFRVARRGSCLCALLTGLESLDNSRKDDYSIETIH